ncbi:MAG: ABC transporter permease [bacterium]|nr:ABC transporter permease [bacterium]
MMKATWSFVLYELRRHLPTLAVGWTLLVIGPVAQRLVEGRWNYWNDWNVAGAAAAVFVVAPLLMVLMAVSGWAAERSAGTLEWQVARPFSAARMFWVRLLTLLGATGIWVLVALLVNGIFRWERFAELFFWAQSWDLAGLLWLEFAGFCLGGGLLASALASRPGVALRGFLVTAVVVGYLVPVLLLSLIPVPSKLLFMGAGAGSLAAHIYGSSIALAFLAGAWIAMRRAPSDRRRIPRAWKTTGGVAVVGVVASVSLALQPLRIDSSQTLRVCWLGDGITLKLARAPGIASVPYRPRGFELDLEGILRRVFAVVHPVLLDDDGSERPMRRIFAVVQPVFAHAGRGLALMRHFESGKLGWLLVDRQGEVRSLDVPKHAGFLGWSRQGSHFAWRIRRPLTPSVPAVPGLLLLDEDLQLRWLSVKTPSPSWTAGWIDDDRILLTWRSAYQFRKRGWWMVISTAGEEVVAPQPLPERTILIPPAVAFSQAHYPQRTDRVDRLVLVLTGPDGTRLANLDLRRGELRPGPAIPWIEPGYSLVSLADGSLVFAQPARAQSATSDQVRILRMPPASLEEPTEVCSFEKGPYFGAGGLYRGITGSWILWTDGYDHQLYVCHLGTGEVRVLGEEELGPLGARSVDVVEDGVLTIRGEIPLG